MVGPREHCSTMDTHAGEEMRGSTACWVCDAQMPVGGSKLIRAKQEHGVWVVKVACASCHKMIAEFPNRIELIEGESWTVRPWVLRAGGV